MPPVKALPQIEVLTNEWSEYELLDSGDRRKLERFGSLIVIRSEQKAWWKPARPASEWSRAVAIHEDNGTWTLRRNTPREWHLRLDKLTLEARFLETSKHVGVFPEQSPHWNWIRRRAPSHNVAQAPRLLNLFGYTGVASLVAAEAGFAVTHVDAAKPAINWGRHNQQLSGLGSKPIRWILEDAVKYVNREIRRGSRYEAILLDPPSFGRGPNREVWKVEKQLTDLLDICRQLLSELPLFIILTAYNLEASSLMLGNLLSDTLSHIPGRVSVGELTLRQSSSTRLLPLSLFARWETEIARP
ncbi:MAG: class I SAM-dependent methyltransferase [Verrucomicrobia bacterium]|nr:class I SAM-dependent methyltransferase [Verrucomicrobiota bacterium]